MMSEERMSHNRFKYRDRATSEWAIEGGNADRFNPFWMSETAYNVGSAFRCSVVECLPTTKTNTVFKIRRRGGAPVSKSTMAGAPQSTASAGGGTHIIFASRATETAAESPHGRHPLPRRPGRGAPPRDSVADGAASPPRRRHAAARPTAASRPSGARAGAPNGKKVVQPPSQTATGRQAKKNKRKKRNSTATRTDARRNARPTRPTASGRFRQPRRRSHRHGGSGGGTTAARPTPSPSHVHKEDEGAAEPKRLPCGRDCETKCL